MTKWEYKIIYNISHIEQLGLDGWELVSVNEIDENRRYLFKRPLEEDLDITK